MAPLDVSMAPLILPTDKPVVKKTKTYKVNDIVVIKDEGRLIAHRIIYKYPDGSFQTKGDNNLTSDGRKKTSQILGKVEKIIRANQSIILSHVYLSQSSTYLKELNLLSKAFKKSRLGYILLKGLPLHLAFGEALPQRLYVDADILVKRKDFTRINKIFARLGYEPIKPRLLGKAVSGFSQISFVKKVIPYAVIIDVHFTPAVGFTKATGLNRLIPSLSRYTKGLFPAARDKRVEASSFPILGKEDLTLYLLLHLYHHNFGGIHRMDFIHKLIRTSKPNMNIVVDKAKKYGFEYFIYPAMLSLNRYFKPFKLPENLAPSYSARVVSRFALNSSPFDEGGKPIEGAKRLIFTLLLSRASISVKLKVLFSKDIPAYFFPAIKSAFFRT